MIEVPHFRFPFGLRGGRFAAVEQDTDEDILQSVRVLLLTPRGSRPELPDYGVADLLFRNDTGEIEGEILDVIREWEPRAEALADAVLTEMIASVEVQLA